MSLNKALFKLSILSLGLGLLPSKCLGQENSGATAEALQRSFDAANDEQFIFKNQPQDQHIIGQRAFLLKMKKEMDSTLIESMIGRDYYKVDRSFHAQSYQDIDRFIKTNPKKSRATAKEYLDHSAHALKTETDEAKIAYLQNHYNYIEHMVMGMQLINAGQGRYQDIKAGGIQNAIYISLKTLQDENTKIITLDKDDLFADKHTESEKYFLAAVQNNLEYLIAIKGEDYKTQDHIDETDFFLKFYDKVIAKDLKDFLEDRNDYLQKLYDKKGADSLGDILKDVGEDIQKNKASKKFKSNDFLKL